jgi:hypothetical protein
MIILGHNEKEKADLIFDYKSANSVKRVVVISPEKFYFEHESDEVVEYANTIEYVYFYRLLQEIDKATLVVLNECLRTINRNDLTFNCIRHFLNQAGHVLIFQYLPIISNKNDFMTLFDFDTKSQWKREKFNKDLFQHTSIKCNKIPIIFNKIDVKTTSHTIYEEKKKKLFSEIGNKDPDTIPRNLYLTAGADKTKVMQPDKLYAARNTRIKRPNIRTYDSPTPNVTILEFPHNFINFIDFISLTKQTTFDVLVTDLKVDLWYFDRYTNWLRNLNETYSEIQQ